MAKETRSLAELVADVANRKSRAAATRAAGSPPSQELPRGVYQAACATIGAHLEKSHGFKYAKSGPRARKRSGDFTFEISFQSDRNNIAGERVGLWIHAHVLSPKLTNWRTTQGFLQPSEAVAGGQIGNLQPDHCWLDWELADPAQRGETVRNAIKLIEQLAIPYFARFKDLPSLIHLLVSEDFPGIEVFCVIEFLLCFADKNTARLAAANFLKRQPRLIPGYYKEMACDLKPEPDWKLPLGMGWTYDLAFASQAFGFGDLAAKGA
jgi:hypothetical protein